MSIQPSTLKAVQLDTSTMHVGAPVETPSVLGVTYGLDLVPYTVAQREMLLTARPYQLRYVISTNRIYYLAGSPTSLNCRWRPVETATILGEAPEAGVGVFSQIVTQAQAATQLVKFHYTSGGSLTNPNLYNVISPALITRFAANLNNGEVYTSYDQTRVVDVASFNGTLSLYVNGTNISVITIELAQINASVHGWYPVTGTDSFGNYVAFQFARPGFTGPNTNAEDGTSLPKLIHQGDHLQAVATYLKLA